MLNILESTTFNSKLAEMEASNPISLGVVGSRTFKDYHLLESTINEFRKTNTLSHIVSGGAAGADSLVRTYAEKHSIPMIELKPDWKKYGKAAGFIRNADIIDESDIVLAFWDGESRGTLDSITKAKSKNTECIVVRF